jgi:hypothetical protein
MFLGSKDTCVVCFVVSFICSRVAWVVGGPRIKVTLSLG